MGAERCEHDRKDFPHVLSPVSELNLLRNAEANNQEGGAAAKSSSLLSSFRSSSSYNHETETIFALPRMQLDFKSIHVQDPEEPSLTGDEMEHDKIFCLFKVTLYLYITWVSKYCGKCCPWLTWPRQNHTKKKIICKKKCVFLFSSNKNHSLTICYTNCVHLDINSTQPNPIFQPEYIRLANANANGVEEGWVWEAMVCLCFRSFFPFFFQTPTANPKWSAAWWQNSQTTSVSPWTPSSSCSFTTWFLHTWRRRRKVSHHSFIT